LSAAARLRAGPPAVCIVTVCRNALSGLKATVTSVRANKRENCRYILIDGASTDGSLEFLRSCADVVDVLVSEPDEGIYHAMNKGIALCGDDSWVIFMNAGDTFHGAQTVADVQAVLARDYDIVMGAVALQEEAREKLVQPDPRIKSKMPACHQSTFTRARLLREYPFDTSLRVGADFEQYLRISEAVEAGRIAFVPFPISRIAADGFSVKNERILQHDYFSAITRHRGRCSAWRWLVERKVRRAARALLRTT